MILCLLIAALDVTVDPRVELFSIVFRVAGSPEYNHVASRSAYAREVAKHFPGTHPAIEAARRLRRERGISYDAVMSLAVHCDDRMRYRFEDRVERLDHRWRMEDVRAFLELVRRYRADSRFDEFFAAHRDFYAAAVEAHRAPAEKGAHLSPEAVVSMQRSPNATQPETLAPGRARGEGSWPVRPGR